MKLTLANVGRLTEDDFETLSNEAETRSEKMTLEQIIERRQEELARMEEHPDVMRLRGLERELLQLQEVRELLRMEDAVTKASKPKPTRRTKTRHGSLAGRIEGILKDAHAFGMTQDELYERIATVSRPAIKRAIEPYLGTVFTFDFVSGLYSLQAREAERMKSLPDKQQDPAQIGAFLKSIPPDFTL